MIISKLKRRESIDVFGLNTSYNEMMKKKFITIVCIFTLIMSITVTPASAASYRNEGTHVKNNVQSTESSTRDVGLNYYHWECASKGEPIQSYGEWKNIVQEYTDGTSTESVKGIKTFSVQNTYTGTLNVPLSKLESFLNLQHGINVTHSITVEKTLYLKGKSAGTWAVQYRVVKNKTPVIQKQYYYMQGVDYATGKTATVYVNAYTSYETRTYKIS